MSNPPPVTQAIAFRLRWHGRQVQTRIPLPTVPLPPRALLPVARQLTSAMVGLAEAAVRDQGREISCVPGCGACCRQLVPVTETEARDLRDLIEEIPEPHRQRIRDRFAAGRKRVAEAGLLEALQNTADVADRIALGLDYFRLGIACPFLEDENCTIHPERPLSCREFLVTSPAENCRAPSAETIRHVVLPTRPMPAFSTLDGPTASGGIRWVPMLLAPEWAESHPEPEPTVPGTELFQRFKLALNEHKFPGSPDPVPLTEDE